MRIERAEGKIKENCSSLTALSWSFLSLTMHLGDSCVNLSVGRSKVNENPRFYIQFWFYSWSSSTPTLPLGEPQTKSKEFCVWLFQFLFILFLTSHFLSTHSVTTWNFSSISSSYHLASYQIIYQLPRCSRQILHLPTQCDTVAR